MTMDRVFSSPRGCGYVLQKLAVAVVIGLAILIWKMTH
jgi:hypothetical protein